jgi:hypothetical protein
MLSLAVDLRASTMTFNTLTTNPLAHASRAGECENPTRSYPILIAVLMPVVTSYIFLPIMVSTTIDPDRANYSPGE